MKMRNFVHKGVKRLYAEDSAKGVPPETVDKLRKMLAFLDDMEGPEEPRGLPLCKALVLTGDRRGTWTLSVTANRRLTFRIDSAESEICHGLSLGQNQGDCTVFCLSFPKGIWL